MDLLLMGVLGFIGLVIVVIVLWLVFTYNALISTIKQLENSWAQIDVQLKRRADLIPNLIETVKGYAKFEKSVLTQVTQARAALLSAKTPKESAKADNALSATLKTIFAVAEAYPTLKANENFKALQEELSSTENKVAFARQAFNDEVMIYNTKVESFPDNILAGMFQFSAAELLQATESAEERKAPKVSFS